MKISRETTDRTKLHEIYNEAQRIIAEELPFLSIYYAKHIWAHRTDTLEGWEPMKEGFNWPMSNLVCSLHLPAVKVTPEVTPPSGPPVELYALGIILTMVIIVVVYYALRKR
jgi:hypothetical protein